ncbi:MAG: NADPH:quinone reductase [Alphaproteobacteria bacterium]|nr:NADPH:quinone reductase [Alphaproteobacteria bacterium]
MAMHAIRIHAFGGPEVLQDDTLPLPVPGHEEILVRIAAASVNPVDGKIRAGKHPSVKDDDLPVTMGRDLSGVVEAMGDNVQGVATCDAVFAMLGWDRGSYAQHVVLKPGEFAPKPQNLSHVEAAAVPLAALTAWQGLMDHGKLQKGQRVLVHGSAGGVGHFAVQIAKAMGAWVATTCSARDIAFVRKLGADRAIDYKAETFEDVVADIDLVYDLVGGETQDRSFKVLKHGGRLVSTLQEPDKAGAIAAGVTGIHYMAAPNASQLAEIGKLLLAGRIKPFVFATYPLQDAAKAQAALEKGAVQGKIVLTVEP